MVQEIQPKVPPAAFLRPEMTAPTPRVAEPVRAPEQVSEPAVSMPPAKPVLNFDPDKERQELQEAISKLNEMLQDSSRTVSFSMDVKLGIPLCLSKTSRLVKWCVKFPMKWWYAWRTLLKISRVCCTTNPLDCQIF